MNEESSGLIPVTDHELFQATTTRGFEPGQTIFNRFVLTRVLGRGGMGIVWLAHDTQLEQDVAIKVLPDVVMHDREAVGDMKRETKRSLQLNHHNIVRIYDFNQDDLGAGISMEYVDGETLSAAKSDRPNGCFDVEDVAPWLEQICDALAYAHNTAKIVHRDLKPANIMLSRSNTIKVTDFGIARSISDSISRVSMRHASSGTMVYMSPQQSSGARSSSSDDIYALGATLYDLLTGKPPFYSGNIQHQLENITPPSMIERRSELDRHGHPIPEIWERVVASCLQKEANLRPASVMELAQRLSLRVSAPMAPTFVTNPPALETQPGYDRTQVDGGAPRAQPMTYSSPPTTTYFPPQAPPVPPMPPPEPTPPQASWLTPRTIKIGASVVGSLVATAITFGLFAFFDRGHGSVAISTMPPGATVTIGEAKMATPALFDAIPSGEVTANLALDGYDPVDEPAKVTKNEKTDLGTTTLKRSTGLLAVTVIPPQATCTLRLVQSDVPSEQPGAVATFPGTTPWQSPPLKTGNYELITSAANFPDGHDVIKIRRNDSQQLVVDLIKEDAAKSLLQDEVAAVNSGDPLPAKLTSDSAAKGRLIAYYQNAFQGYMKASQFDLAESQLKHLNADLGVSTADEEKQIADGRQIAEKGQGSVAVKTTPPGASVTLSGRTLTTPAVFDKVLAGADTAEIKLAGYDPVELPAQVNRDAVTDLGSVQLTRSTGSIQIETIPHHAAGVLNLVQSQAADEEPKQVGPFSGPETFKSGPLGTGTYSVTVTADGLPGATQSIELKKGDNLQITMDLVKENATHLLSADQLAVVSNDQPIPDAMKQDASAKAALTSYYQQVFNGYLQLKEFKLAEGALHHLSGDLGVESTQNQQMLDQLETEWMTSQKASLTQLIQQERFDQADALLTDMETHGPQPELRQQLDAAKTAHESGVTQALANIDTLENSGNEAGAEQAAKEAASKDKLEPRLAIRLASIESAMPSAYDRVEERVSAMKAMLGADSTLSQNGEFTRLIGMFQENLDKHDEFRSQIGELKHEVDSFGPKIASLRADAKHNEDKANGYRALSIFGIAGAAGALSQNSGAGALGGLGAAGVGQNGATARENDVRGDNSRISDLQGEQAEKQQQLEAVREQYATFEKSPINSIQ